MDFGLTQEQEMIVETTRAFVENELYPHEPKVERTGHLDIEWCANSEEGDAAGLYAANIPRRIGGAGLDTPTWLLYEKNWAAANYALHSDLCRAIPFQHPLAPALPDSAPAISTLRGGRENEDCLRP